MKDRSRDDTMAEIFRDDPAYAITLLNDILENGDQGELMIVLRQMSKAFGGIRKVAEQADLNPTQIYRILSREGNPQLKSFNSMLHAMGLRLSVQPIQKISDNV